MKAAKVLLIDDEALFVKQAVQLFGKLNYDNVAAPQSLEECLFELSTFSYKAVMIDFNLKNWVRENKNAINLGGKVAYDGIGIGEYLISVNKNIRIGFYSSSEEELKRKLQKSPIFQNGVEVLSRTNRTDDNNLKYCTDFIDKLYNMDISVKPLHKEEQNIPTQIQSFFNKKILKYPDIGEWLLQTGKYIWQIAVNQPLSEQYSEIERYNNELYTYNNSINQYKIKYDRKNDLIQEFEFGETSLKITNIKPNSLPKLYLGYYNIFEFFYTKCFCELYLDLSINEKDFIKILSKVSDKSKLESQCILFKEFSLQHDTRENVHSAFDKLKKESVLKKESLHSILDIYKGRVDDIDRTNKTASVRFESLSPKKIVRRETLSIDFLDAHALELESQFEYTLYEDTAGGTATNIEPI
jgi:hypothetical protein